VLLLLSCLLTSLILSSTAFARLYEARLMGVNEETAIWVERGDADEVKVCSPALEALDDVDQEPVPETRIPCDNNPTGHDEVNAQRSLLLRDAGDGSND
jgi:hypothetical protein